MPSEFAKWSAPLLAWIDAHPVVAQVAGLGLLLLLSLLVHLLLRRVIVRSIDRFVQQSSVSWDNALGEARVFDRLAQLLPAIVFWYGVQLLPQLNDNVATLVQRVVAALMIVLVARTIAAFLGAANAIYAADPDVEGRSIKGYLQLVALAIYVVAAVLVVATLMDRSPMLFLSGIGALTAVLLLIFRDTLLGLVASVQIAKNDMLRVGDWIEMPRYNADGDVIDIALHTVKVQNWDKTITAIPTSKFLEESFKNWRGMSISGGRRIKRSLFFDVNTVRFLDEDEVERFGRYALLRDYIAAKRREIDEYNAAPGRDPEQSADIRRLTNIGTLRAYVERYLGHHPRVHQGMTLLVRQLQPAAEGLPIEIYCFTNTTDWGAYEEIQADIFDHILAVLPEFDLRVFQRESDYSVSPATAQVPARPAVAAGRREG